MRMRTMGQGVGIATVVFLLAACSSGSGSTSTSGGTTTGGVSSLADVPLDVVDPSAYGVDAASASISVTKGAPQVGQFSIAGCTAERMKRNVIRSSMLPKVILCYMKVMEEKAGMVMGDNAYNHYLFEAPGGPQQLGGTMSMKIGVGKFGDTLRMSMCNNGAKSVEFEISRADGHYVGYMIDNWDFGANGTERGLLTFDADGPPENYTRAIFDKSYNSSEWGYHQMGIEATPSYDIVYGQQTDHWQGNDILRRMYSKFSASEGKAIYDETGTSPSMLVSQTAQHAQQWHDWLVTPVNQGGMGWTDDTRFCLIDEDPWMQQTNDETCPVSRGGSENYTIGTEAVDLVERYVVAATSTFESDVTDANLPTAADPAAFEFRTTEMADCAAAEGFAAPPTTPAASDFATCLALEEQQNRWEDEGDCWQADQANRQR